MKLSELAGRRVIVWGAGREGRAAARAVRAAGVADVVAVTDTEPDPETASTWASTGLADVAVLAGDAGRARLGTCEVLVLSPGVSRYRDEVLDAERRGVVVTNGTELFLAQRAGSTVAVTGSKGKSTVTRLIAHLLVTVGREAVAGGNVGVSLLDLVDDDRQVVAEVSSYQSALVTTGPSVAVLTSLFPEHLPWHGGLDQYYADKLRLFTAQGHHRRGLANGADPGVTSMLSSPALSGVTTFGDPASDIRIDDGAVTVRGERAFSLVRSPLPGAHNAVNVAAAVATLDLLGVDVLAERDRLDDGLAGFSQLPHRLESIGVVDGVTFVDDSLATTPQAVIAACEAFAEVPVVLLVGGLDRGIDFTPLVDYLEARAAETAVGIVLMGPAGRRLAPALRGVSAGECDDVTDAVAEAAALAGGQGVVMLAPAAPSPPPYGTYERRAQAFRVGVERLASAASA